MQRRIVDLPEPEGPAITIASPRVDLEVDLVEDEVVAEALPYALQGNERIAPPGLARCRSRAQPILKVMTGDVETLAISAADVEAAAERLAGHAHRTPVLDARGRWTSCVGARVLLKAENLQRGGAVQVPRRLQRDVAPRLGRCGARGVLAFSSGNHAQAVALAARLLGTARRDRDAGGRAGVEASPRPRATAPRSSATTATPRTAQAIGRRARRGAGPNADPALRPPAT